MTAASTSLTFGASVLLFLCACCLSACGKERPVETLDPHVQVLDFSEKRHTLHVALIPEVAAWIPRESTTGRIHDLRLGKESGHPFGVTGNGRRSVAFVRVGSTEDFQAFLAIDTWKKLNTFTENGGVYFSPQLRSEEAVEGCMFFAQILRSAGEPGENGETPPDSTSWARIRIEKIEDTSVTLRVVVGPPLVP